VCLCVCKLSLYRECPSHIFFFFYAPHKSDGGLSPFNDFGGHQAILSGPAGGVVGYAKTTYDDADKIPVIGFDMGGTSTDVVSLSSVVIHLSMLKFSMLTSLLFLLVTTVAL
jgi:N-methylhydantoinase A/oxoprolinase/acetone carboxylase beta subunit